jgi:hypothetical protein
LRKDRPKPAEIPEQAAKAQAANSTEGMMADLVIRPM